MDHPAMIWFIEHTASILNRVVVGDDGQTADQRLHGQIRGQSSLARSSFVTSPEAICTKMSMRWRIGMYLGVAPQSGEHYVGTWDEHVIRNRSIVWVVESSRWDTDFLENLKGAPSKPNPSRVDRYSRIEEREDPHAMIEIDSDKCAHEQLFLRCTRRSVSHEQIWQHSYINKCLRFEIIKASNNATDKKPSTF